MKLPTTILRNVSSSCHLLTMLLLLLGGSTTSPFRSALAFAPTVPLSSSPSHYSRVPATKTSPMSSSSRRSSATALRMVSDDAKVILVTGSSRGLGKAIALEIAKSKQKLVINYVSDGSKEAAEATVEEIKQLGSDAIAVQADSSNPDDIDDLFKQVVDAYGTCDVLINNAGITRDGLVMRMKPDDWKAVIDVNLSGVFYCTKAFFKLASKKRSGRIVNIGSVVALIGNPGQANYAAAKGGVLGMTRSNAKEFAARGITVNCVCPGFIDTDMTAELTEDYLNHIKSTVPLKRLGKPSEVAGMTRFLALDPSVDYITGHTFNVDGGLGMGT